MSSALTMPRPASSFSTSNSGIIAPPSTFEVNGVQYVAVQSGYGVNAAFRQELMNQLVGWQRRMCRKGGVVWVFAVSK